LGLPVALVVTGGEVSDVKGYAPVMAEPGPKVLIADKGYDADAILADLSLRGVAAVVPPRRERTHSPPRWRQCPQAAAPSPDGPPASC
jgi:transposase